MGIRMKTHWSTFFLANKMIHKFNPEAITIAEEMSGMPGLASDTDKMGYGFDFRLSMGVPDFWIKLVKETLDENWIWESCSMN